MNTTAVLYAMLSLGGMGLVFGLMLTFAEKKFRVEPLDERIEDIFDVLPHVNCGVCGFAGCSAYAEAIVTGGAKPNLCVPGGQKTAQGIAEVLKLPVAFEDHKLVAKVVCQGEEGVSKQRYEYVGYPSCKMASSMSGGPKKCPYACVGLGDCARACAFGAIQIKDGLAVVDEEKCTACGVCQSVCPRHSIQLKPQSAVVMVRCQNRDTVPKIARENCMKACIACKRCVKECPVGAIAVEDGYARIDPEKCTRCGLCAKVCPCGCITVA